MPSWLNVFALLGSALLPVGAQKRRCAYLASPSNALHLKEAGNVSGAEQLCGHTPCCMGYFKLGYGPPIPDLLGCNVVQMECPESSCFSSHHMENFTSCVCNTDFCNANLTWLAPSTPSPSPWGVSSICMVVVPLALLLILCIFMCHRSIRKGVAKPSYGRVTSQCSCHGLQGSDLDLGCIELRQMVGQGHFASVWSGYLRGAPVAVKVFPARSIQQYLRERTVYSLALLDHAGVLRFLGAGTAPQSRDRFLVLELAAQGSLRSFLSHSSCSWACSLRLAQSLSHGLAFLHADLQRNGTHKPPVAHGDLSSSNAVVRADGSCALCDFGCSTILCSCPEQPGWQQHRNIFQVGSAQVGTLCYMSPEVLEGCVNLGSSRYLLQGDLYSLGLLLWEVWTRCHELYPGSAVLEHRLPYEEVLGVSPSLGELVHWVSERRERPPIPLQWGQRFQEQGIYTIREILEDCWDHDPEARLTAQGAAERLATLAP
ncbi:anti-Muellerian hormone type-2 receptor-like isoform X1 [Anguilla anguilla]|uniref:anti-Muellerian hormone type-2 receptor-like isoform X1 n=1 Tax=Anguilla anguilla TaxID=7936 RepID=UPI0015A7F755|nr:anti-Muellerian hormone type-2 receptor-like isoform X1 [Anguilla anguilla]